MNGEVSENTQYKLYSRAYQLQLHRTDWATNIFYSVPIPSFTDNMKGKNKVKIMPITTQPNPYITL